MHIFNTQPRLGGHNWFTTKHSKKNKSSITLRTQQTGEILAVFGDRNSKNYGYGNTLSYAGFNALRTSYNGGHFSTVASHAKRWKKFCIWLKNEVSINSIKDVTQEIFECYARELNEQVLIQEISVDYAQNILSSVNIVMEIMRENKKIWVSPSSCVGKRNNVRTEIPKSLDYYLVECTVRDLNQSNNKIAAAVLNAARAFGVRVKEAVLLNYCKSLKDAKKSGRIRIKEGTKGGRGHTIERYIAVTEKGMKVLEQNANLQGENANLIPKNQTWIEVDTFIHNHSVRNIFKKNSLKFYHDARAAYACERYKQITGYDAPVVASQRIPSQEVDQNAREIIADELGHSRKNICLSYIGSEK